MSRASSGSPRPTLFHYNSRTGAHVYCAHLLIPLALFDDHPEASTEARSSQADSKHVTPELRLDKSNCLLDRLGRKRNSDSRLSSQLRDEPAHLLSEAAMPLSRHESTLRRRRDGVTYDLGPDAPALRMPGYLLQQPQMMQVQSSAAGPLHSQPQPVSHFQQQQQGCIRRAAATLSVNSLASRNNSIFSAFGKQHIPFLLYRLSSNCSR